LIQSFVASRRKKPDNLKIPNMKTKHILATAIILSNLLLGSTGHAQSYIEPVRSGNWSDTNLATSPWPNGILPQTNSLVEVDDNIVITVDTTNAVCNVLDSLENGVLINGTIIMAPGSTLTVEGTLEGYGTQSLGYFNASATNCTVIYLGNAFWAYKTNYYNLVLDGWGDFYNGADLPSFDFTPMTIYGNMTVGAITNIPADQTNLYTGVYVECGDNITVMGNLYLGAYSAWDCSHSNTVVYGTTYCAGYMWDQDAAEGSNYFAGNFIVPANTMVITNQANTLVKKYNTDNGLTNGPTSTVIYGGLDLQTGTNWYMGASLTNNGFIRGQGYGSINFTGSGVIAGSNALTLPTIWVNGTYQIDTSIILTTNTPGLNGTLVFDLANTNQVVLQPGAGTELFYGGNLDVINTGATPASGNNYQLFYCANGYNGGFNSETFPSLPAGLSWVDNTLTSGSIAVTGAVLGAPTLTLSRSGATLTLSWDSTTYTGYSVQAQTNSASFRANWYPTGSGTVSPYMININPASQRVFFRLSNP
jgi:hypothetical protein